MQTPKFLQDIKTRLFATGATTVGAVGATAYLASVPQQQLTQSLESAVGTFLATILMATAPPLANAFIGIATNLMSGDLYNRFTKKEFYRQIPEEANLYQATFFAFQSILNEVIKNEEKSADKKQIKKLRDISLESWVELVSLDEQEDDISEVAEAILTKFNDEKIIENQFLKDGNNGKKNLLKRQDWLILLLRLQDKEETSITSDLENKILDALERDYTEKLRIVFSAHQEIFQEVTLQLWETLFEKLDVLETKVENVPQKTAEYLRKEGLVKSQAASKFLPKNFPQSLIYFTGRKQVLENIADALENHGTAAFADTHGVGKSSVVIEFAHLNKDIYEHILFIRATNNEFNIYVSDIVKDLGFDLPEDAKPEERLVVLQDWLAKNQDWLLLVDNVDDVDFIHKCGFNKPNGKVIYTSNNDKIFRFATKVELPKLNDENAMLLLYKHWQDKPDAKFEDTPEKVKTALQGIAEKFGNHPFSMAFVGSYLAEENESLEEFLNAYQSKEKNLLEKYKFLNDYKHEEVATAFLLRFEQISTPNDDSEREQLLSAAAKDYLGLSAFVGTDNIPEELLQQCLISFYPDYTKWTECRDFIKEIYKRFKPTSIFKRDAENKTLTTHRIVQEIMRFQIEDEKDLILKTLAQVLANNFEYFNFTNTEKVERYLLHVGAFLKYLEENKAKTKSNLKLENVSTANLCDKYSIYFQQYGRYEKALKYCEFFRDICKDINDIENLVGSYSGLKSLFYKLARYKEWKSASKKQIKILEKYVKSLGVDDSEFDNVLDRDEENRLKEIIENSKKLNGANHQMTASTYWRLADFYASVGKYEEAEPLFRKVLKIRKKKTGENHPSIATIYKKLGNIYYLQRKSKKAEIFFLKALAIHKTVLGEDHPDTGLTYMYLSSFYYLRNRFQEGLEFSEKALKILQNTLPANHPNIQTCESRVKEIKNIIYVVENENFIEFDGEDIF